MSSCECYQIGGRFIAEDPECAEHGTEAQAEREQITLETEVLKDKIESLEAEVQAWRSRFARYSYFPEDDNVQLALFQKSY